MTENPKPAEVVAKNNGGQARVPDTKSQSTIKKILVVVIIILAIPVVIGLVDFTHRFILLSLSGTS